MLANILPRLKVLGKFVSMQVLVQVIGFASGILLVRTLDKRQYAFFTLANTMQGTMTLLADCGIGIGLTSIGGKVWRDRYRFGQLIKTALGLRISLAIIAMILVVPILFWMLINNGASVSYAVFIVLSILVALNAQLTTGILDVVPRLHSQIKRLQNLDFVSAAVRAFLLLIAYFSYLNAAIAILLGSVSLLLKNRILRKWVVEDVDMDAPPSQEDRTAIIKIMKQQAGNSIFFSMQGQITVWLVGIFGSVQSIAEVGALGRLTVILNVINALMFNIVGPGFARCQSRVLLVRRYFQVLACYGFFCIALMLAAGLFPDVMLWFLGKQYSHLRNELLIITLGAVLSTMLGGVWGMNASRGWIKFVWLYPPLTIATQILLLFFLKVGTTQGAVWFGTLSWVPNLILNLCMSYWGFQGEAASEVAA